MKFNQTNYISKYNKANYKMYQFRVRKDSPLINTLDRLENRNKHIVSLIENDRKVLTIKQIKQKIKPILNKHGIKYICLFGSYARGEANVDSDVDIFCDKGNIKTLIEQGRLEEELKKALKKDVDVVFKSSKMNEHFNKQIKEDMIILETGK